MPASCDVGIGVDEGSCVKLFRGFRTRDFRRRIVFIVVTIEIVFTC